MVPPLAGGWIEIMASINGPLVILVPPLAGGWIEICYILLVLVEILTVPPLAGEWIEIDNAKD